ncbi:unnamed protein product [Merluccius merluccius]
MMSALLDPSFCFYWLEQDVLAPDEVKSEVKEMIIDLVLAEARKVTILAESSSGEDDKDEPPDKTPRLFAGYRKKSNKKDDHVSSVQAELIRYIQVSSDEVEADCLGFWKRHAKVFPRLYLVAMRVLTVPATSAPVERVFRDAPGLKEQNVEDRWFLAYDPAAPDEVLQTSVKSIQVVVHVKKMKTSDIV